MVGPSLRFDCVFDFLPRYKHPPVLFQIVLQMVNCEDVLQRKNKDPTTGCAFRNLKIRDDGKTTSNSRVFFSGSISQIKKTPLGRQKQKKKVLRGGGRFKDVHVTGICIPPKIKMIS